MADRPWKQFERDIARLLGGRRYPANTGGGLDVEGAGLVAQCKLVRRLSLGELSELAEQVARDAGPTRTGVVAVKLRRGRGRPTPILIVQTAAEWVKQHGDTFRVPE